MKSFYLLILCLVPLCLSAQFETTTLNQYDELWYQNSLLRAGEEVHTAIRPYRASEVQAYDRRLRFLTDSVADEKGVFPWVKRKVWNEHLFAFSGE